MFPHVPAFCTRLFPCVANVLQQREHVYPRFVPAYPLVPHAHAQMPDTNLSQTAALGFILGQQWLPGCWWRRWPLMGGEESGLPGRKLLLLHVRRRPPLLGLGSFLCNREHVPGCTRVLYPLVPRRWERSTAPGTRVPAFCTRVPQCSYTLQTTRRQHTANKHRPMTCCSRRGSSPPSP